MRTLKKTLCLVLCLAMMAGLCVIGTSAAFTDADEIQNKEAVDVMVGIGIITGRTDGSFDPSGVLNRAEAAKIITYLVLGKEEAEKLAPVDTKFDDVKATGTFAWASGFVNYCASAGIIAGTKATTFDPAGKLTAAAWGKMLLCALGYNAETEGLVGDSWDFNVSRLLAKTKMAAGVNAQGKAEMTRDEACLMAFNALAVPKVEYAGGTKITTSDGTTITMDAEVIDSREYLGTLFGLSIDPAAKDFVKGDIDSVTFGLVEDAPADDTTIVKTEAGDKTFKENFGADSVGHVFKIYYKGAAEPYTVIAKEDVTVKVEITKDMTAKQVKAAFYEAGVKADIPAATEILANGKLDSAIGDAIVLGTTAGSAAIAGTYLVDKFTGADPVVVAKIGTDKNINVVSKITAYKAPTASATGSVTIEGLTAAGAIGVTAAITLQKLGSEDPNVVELYETPAVGDYVYVTKATDASTAKVEKAEVLEAVALTKFSGTTATIDGANYTTKAFAANGTVTANDTDLATLGLTAVDSTIVGATQRNFVLTADGKVLGYYAYAAASSATEYAMIVDCAYTAGEAPALANNYTTTYAKFSANVLLADGTKAVYTYTSKAKNMAVADLKTEMGVELAQWDVIKYGVSDKVFTAVEKVAEAPAVAAAEITAARATVAAGVYLTASTPILYQDPAAIGSDATVITGYSKAKDADDGEAFFVTDANGSIVIVFVKKAYTADAVVASNIAYLVDYTIEPDTEYDATLKSNKYTYTVSVDGKDVDLVSKTKLVPGVKICEENGYVEYIVTDGYLTEIKAAITGYTKVAAAEITFVDASIAIIDGVEYPISAAKIYTDDTANDGGVTAGGALAKGQTVVALYKNADLTKALTSITIINAKA